MIPRPISDIDVEALRALIENAVPEGKTIEYKRHIPGKAESDVGVLLATVAAFANTSGGDLLLGVDEDKGVAVGLPGIEIANLDDTTRQLDEKWRNGVEPRLPRVDIRSIEVSQAKHVVVVRIPQSWAAPHRVKKNNRFYMRQSARNEPMDVGELRTAFTMSEAIADRIRDFRFERIARIQSDRAPVRLDPGGRMLLHILPLSAFSKPIAVNMRVLEARTNRIGPMGNSGWNHRVNVDGFLTFSAWRPEASRAYTQIFRTGVVESVSVLSTQDGRVLLPSTEYEEDIIKMLTEYLQVAANLEVQPPYFVFLSFACVKGARLGLPSNRRWWRDEQTHTVPEDTLMLPEVVIDEHDVPVEKLLRPLFDTVWNAFGFIRSFNYDEQGDRVGR